MKKKLILLVAAVIILAAVSLGYHNINTRYPAAVVREAAPGDTLEYQKGVLISANKKEVLSEEEVNQAFEALHMESLADTKIFKITITLNNTTQETQELSMTDLNLVTIGCSNGISKLLIDFSDDSYDRVMQTLEPGEIKQVTFPYEMLSSWFSKEDWEHIEEREFWLSFSEYPVKTILKLE